MNALYRTEESFRDYDTNIRRFFVAPVVSVKLGDRTDLTLDLEYRNDRRPSESGLVAIGNRVADVPFNRIFSEPDDFYRSDFIRTGYTFEHRFSDKWKLRNAFHFNSLTPAEFISLSGGFFPVDEATGTLTRVFTSVAQPNDRFELQTNVVGEFSTGPINHKLLVGVDLIRDNFDAFFQADFANAAPFNIFNPVFGVPRPDFDTVPVAFDGEFQTDRLGIYLQDQITLLDNLKLLAGVRYDAARQTGTNNLTGVDNTPQNYDAFSPRVGVVYQPIEEVSLFASYSRSFTPNDSTTVTGDFLQPERGQQFEVGIKTELLDKKISASFAYFDITKSNVATTDPNNPFFSVATGEQRSQGIELDVIGELLPGWKLVANYAYTDARITEDNGGLVGNQLFNVPDHSFNLWTTYEIQNGSLEGLGFGIGFNYVSDRFGDNANSFVLDSYFLTNASLSFRRGKWRVGLNIRNLFDIDFIESAENNRSSEIFPGEDFTVIGSVSVEL